jgi:hypothetical protein
MTVDRKNRTAAEYQWLRAGSNFEKTLKDFVDSTVSVPRFPLLPKGLNEADLGRFIFSQQRADLLRELNAKVTDGTNTAAGYVLSGPQGIGKSVEMYLFASYLYVNKHPLVYVPSCQVWKRAPYSHLVQQFGILNHDLLDEFVGPGVRAGIEAFLKEPEDLNNKAPVLWQGIVARMTLKPTRLCMLYDEHNELFKDTPPFIERSCVSSLLSRSRLVVLI